MSPSEHRNTRRLEVLEGAGEVEEGLRTGAYRHQRVGGDRVEICADVAGVGDLAMNAADAAGRENRDPSGRCQREGRRDGGRTELPALGDGHRDIPLR